MKRVALMSIMDVTYFCVRQPASHRFNLQEGSYRIDVIDTWNMTIDTVADDATGQTHVDLPTRILWILWWIS
jgi:hypothetical protein